MKPLFWTRVTATVQIWWAVGEEDSSGGGGIAHVSPAYEQKLSLDFKKKLQEGGLSQNKEVGLELST